jgi:hypothetical protein
MELRPSSIVALLWKRNNVVLVHCYVAGHRRQDATETITCNNNVIVRFSWQHDVCARNDAIVHCYVSLAMQQ